MNSLENIRAEFPILQTQVNGKPLVYLDNAATSQKPKVVLDAIQQYYTQLNANVHRGIHTLSQEATNAMEVSRKKIQKFINAQHDYEVLFTSGTTEGINIVANGLKPLLKAGDEILITQLEHHANIVPWQMLCEQTGAVLKYIPMTPEGILEIEKLDTLISEKTKIVAFNHISNALGVINPAQTIIEKAHKVGAWVLLDAAQSAPHQKIDVQALDVEFLVFSGHKMYGPTGVGILYGKENILAQLAPFKGGGEMIKEVTLEKTTYAGLPFKYEAGTPNICGNIALGHAVDFMHTIGIENIQNHEAQLLNYATQKLAEIPEITIYAQNAPRAGAVSFNLNFDHVHSSDVGMILDKMGIAVRTGHHCAQPIMQYFNIPGTVRASFACYNTQEEVDQLIAGVKLAIQMLG